MTTDKRDEEVDEAHEFYEAAREALIPRLRSTIAKLVTESPNAREAACEAYFYALEALDQLISEEFKKLTDEHRGLI